MPVPAALRQSLGGLFPEAPRAVARPPLIVLAHLVAGAAVVLFRQAMAGSLNVIWAEDGRIFLGEAVQHGVRAIGRTYEGYLHLAPRLIATVVAALPASMAARALAVGAAVTVGAVVVFVFHAAAGHVPDRNARLALSFLVALLPVAGYEILDNVANVHWYLLFGAFWGLLWRPSTRWGGAAAAAVCFLAAASDPLACLFVPLAVTRVIALPRAREHLATAGLGLGLVLQTVMVLTAENGANLSDERGSLRALVAVYVFRVVAAFFTGDHLTESMFWLFGWGFVVVAAVVALVLMVTFIRWRLAARPAFLVTCVVLQAAFFLLPAYLRWSSIWVPHRDSFPLDFGFGSRYVAMPHWLLFGAVAASLSVGPGLLAPERWRAIRLGAVVAVLLVVGADFVAVGPRNLGPQWPDALRSARATCRAGAHEVHVQTAPPIPFWRVPLPCDRLD